MGKIFKHIRGMYPGINLTESVFLNTIQWYYLSSRRVS